MLSSLGCLLLCGSITLALGNAQKLPKGKRPNLKVHINTTSDSILLKFLRPSPNVKLEGLLLGYGSNVSPNQYFPLPAEGKFTEAIVDAEPKYLIVVRPAPPPSQKKSCSGKTRSRKPLQLVVGTLTPSSVFLSWGFLINPHHDWTLPSHCPNDRFYTIRYREKDKEKKWIFQICPATETIVENLKPNTVYEFGVKDNVEGGIWSKIFNHKTVVGSKKVNGKIQSTYDQDHAVPAYVPRKLIPITIIKQVIQNVTHKDSTKSPEKAPLGGVILVHLIIPGLNETTVKLPASLMFEISDALKTQLAKNETLALPAKSKTPEVEKISARSTTETPETVPRTTKPTTSSALDVSETTLASSEKPWIVPTAKISEDSKVLQPQTATYDVFSSPTTSDEPEISESYTATSDRILDSVPPKTSRTLEQPRATLAPRETPFVPQKLEIFTSPEMQPTTAAPQQTTSIPSTPKRRPRPKPPRTKPERTTSAGTITPKISKSPEPTWTTPAPSKTQFISLKPKIPLSPEVTHTKPAPKQTPRALPKPKTSPRPRIPQTQPVPKGPQRITAKPKTSPSPEVSYTTPAPKDVLLPHKPDPEVSQSEPAPLETRGIPFIPMISPSPSQEELQTILEETDQSTQERFTTKIPRTTELAKTTQAPHRFYTTVRPRTSDKPHIRPVLHRTTTRPTRPKPSGMPSGNGVGTGVKQAPKPSGADRNVSVDSPHPTKKPGTRRPPLPPRPTPPRRKPLPPNNVTGKPGSAGIISSSPITIPPLRSTLRPTGTPLERIATDIKQPTVPASGEELENITDFSSSPTRETDPLGKPRFKGPHVRYLQKPDDSPCSITDSVKRFPKEDATEGNATSPPQNPPTNLTVVTVEGCPSFVILDWEKPLNDTVTEYEVISRENGSFSGKNKSIQITNQTFSTVENLKPNTSYEFQVKPKNPLGEGPVSNTVAFSTESADPRVSEPVSAGRDAIWTERPFDSDSYSECKGKQYVKRTWYKKFVGVQLCNSLRYKIYLSDSLTGKFYNIGDQRGHGEDHCQFVDSFLDGRTGQQLTSDQLPIKEGYFRAVRQEPVQFGEIGGHTQINYVQWYECGTTIPGKW
ncbi:target of Nesh-SH3 isoform X20 [Macaca thibetana thibetana]|uniref:target of Nesh-SH3 isoform X47 n=1 Tax=Macaca fascicularis TaxID=9541 RepID=UPI000D2FB1AB|nr:target of Nesh-SH3 isoform X22 [Macaca nemestrina]XP_028700512.1 target of Nesh-SH3 isoform X28 [Macaca mulatta]XP_050637993.1 target of Nesh-SH3 isoform X20 [Macaca thibetana thibetana]